MNAKTYKSVIEPLISAGINEPHAMKLVGIARQLHAWHELECGTDRGAIQRNEDTDEIQWYDNRTHTWGPYYGRDTETLATGRLALIMANYPNLTPYIQSDPRGAALYILRPGDVLEGADPNAYYSRGIAIYS